MLLITVNPVVLNTLKAAFPKANSAQNILDKYIRLLEDQLTKSESLGRSAWMQSNDLYSISIYKQRNRGGQIGPHKIRLQNWLENNDLELFKISILGSNLNKKLSVIKLTDLVTVTYLPTIYTTQEENESKELNELFEAQNLSNENLFRKKYPEIANMQEDEILELFDIVPIDVNSLQNYIHWLDRDSLYIDENKKLRRKLQAEYILRIAQHTDGIYLQRKKPSTFGRNYYQGISVQNVNKELRRAMLGYCWEYDIRSAVFSWKMGFAQECYESLRISDPFEKTFSVTLNYLNNKPDFMMTVRHYTFTDESPLSREDHDKQIKQAVTAISFGARKGTTGWTLNGTDWKNPALVKIFKNLEDRERFLKCSVMKKFIAEQNLLDKYIFQVCKNENPPFMQKEEVRTLSGALSKAKVIAYLYQHFETEVMNVAQRAIESTGRKVVARIHDAIIIDKRLGVDNKQFVEEMMKSATGNPYWHLTAKELEPYHRSYSMDKDEISEHKRRIREESRLAETNIAMITSYQ